MKIKYKFVTGERVELEVNDEFSKIIIELESEIKNNNRKETRRHEKLSSFDKNSKNSDFSVDIYAKVLKILDKDKLYAAIEKLKPKEQELLHTLYFNKNPISQVELSKIQNVSVGSIKMRLHRIKEKLGKLL